MVLLCHYIQLGHGYLCSLNEQVSSVVKSSCYMYFLFPTPQATFSTHLNIEIHFYLSCGSLTCPNRPSMNEFIVNTVESNTFLMCFYAEYFIFLTG